MPPSPRYTERLALPSWRESWLRRISPAHHRESPSCSPQLPASDRSSLQTTLKHRRQVPPGPSPSCQGRCRCVPRGRWSEAESGTLVEPCVPRSGKRRSSCPLRPCPQRTLVWYPLHLDVTGSRRHTLLLPP